MGYLENKLADARRLNSELKESSRLLGGMPAGGGGSAPSPGASIGGGSGTRRLRQDVQAVGRAVGALGRGGGLDPFLADLEAGGGPGVR